MTDPNDISETLAAPRVSGSDEMTTLLLRARALDAPPRPGLIGAVDRFEVLGLIGCGGMGVVLLAREPETDTQVALKMLRPEFAREPQTVKRFLTEARHMYKLDHPSVLSVLEVSAREAGPYYVMPFKPCGSLAHRIETGQALDAETAVRIASGVAGGLAYAHAQGLIHRDVKPHNVLIEPDGRAVLADFGLVRTVFNDSIIEPGREGRLGTLAYMSPAVARGDAEDTRCDIYSFGAMLYEMLTGEPPYSGQSREAILNAILSGPPMPIAKRSPKAHPGLSAIVEGCMARELRDRYASMEDVVRDLNCVAASEFPLGPRGSAKPRGKPWLVPTLGASLIIAVIGLLIYSYRPSTPPNSLRSSDAEKLLKMAQAKLARPFEVQLPAAAADDQTIASLRAKVAANPANAAVLYELSQEYLKQDRRPEALQAALRTVALRPQDSGYWSSLGLLMAITDQADSGFAAVSEALRLEPDSPRAFHSKAYCHHAKGETEQAIADFKRVLTLSPDHADALNWITRCLNRLQRFAEAEDYARRAINENSTDIYGWQVLGDTLYGLDRFAEAADAYEHVMRDRPDLVPADRRPEVLRSKLAHLTSQPVAPRLPTKTLDLGEGVTIELVLIPAGEFMMGSLVVGPRHRVTITKSFYMGRYEVTQSQWLAVMGRNPSRYRGDYQQPVDTVSRDDSRTFCKQLSGKTGRTFRLPTEAEWEYVCRAGNNGKYCFGDDEADLEQYGWFDKNSGGTTHAVGGKKANTWGLYDMHGNVSEWCEDIWHDNYDGAPTDGSAWMSGGDRYIHVSRGGNRSNSPVRCQSAFRNKSVESGDFLGNWGFRVVMEIDDTSSSVVKRGTAPPEATQTAIKFPSMLDLGKSVTMEFVLIPSGDFLMGSPMSEEARSADEGPQHWVRIEQPFYIGKYEVTNSQYRRFKPDHNSGTYQWVNLNDNDHPVVQVSWDDAKAFCAWLSSKLGRDVRLPTEAQWEYTARSGDARPFPWGNSWPPLDRAGNYADETAKRRFSDWMSIQGYRADGYAGTSPVGSFSGNGFGVYDMGGNVFEWCKDWYHDSYNGAPSDGSAWTNDGEQKCRVVRGGSWGSSSLREVRCAFRSWQSPGLHSASSPVNSYGISPNSKVGLGFRVAMDLTDEELAAVSNERPVSSEPGPGDTPTSQPH